MPQEIESRLQHAKDIIDHYNDYTLYELMVAIDVVNKSGTLGPSNMELAIADAKRRLAEDASANRS